MVEFFSAEMVLRVWRQRSCRAEGDSAITIEASFKARDAFISPSAAITFRNTELMCQVPHSNPVTHRWTYTPQHQLSIVSTRSFYTTVVYLQTQNLLHYSGRAVRREGHPAKHFHLNLPSSPPLPYNITSSLIMERWMDGRRCSLVNTFGFWGL